MLIPKSLVACDAHWLLDNIWELWPALLRMGCELSWDSTSLRSSPRFHTCICSPKFATVNKSLVCFNKPLCPAMNNRENQWTLCICIYIYNNQNFRVIGSWKFLTNPPPMGASDSLSSSPRDASNSGTASEPIRATSSGSCLEATFSRSNWWCFEYWSSPQKRETYGMWNIMDPGNVRSLIFWRLYNARN